MQWGLACFWEGGGKLGFNVLQVPQVRICIKNSKRMFITGTLRLRTTYCIYIWSHLHVYLLDINQIRGSFHTSYITCVLRKNKKKTKLQQGIPKWEFAIGHIVDGQGTDTRSKNSVPCSVVRKLATLVSVHLECFFGTRTANFLSTFQAFSIQHVGTCITLFCHMKRHYSY